MADLPFLGQPAMNNCPDLVNPLLIGQPPVANEGGPQRNPGLQPQVGRIGNPDLPNQGINVFPGQGGALAPLDLAPRARTFLQFYEDTSKDPCRGDYDRIMRRFNL
jgi:hypothetical protein